MSLTGHQLSILAMSFKIWSLLLWWPWLLSWSWPAHGFCPDHGFCPGHVPLQQATPIFLTVSQLDIGRHRPAAACRYSSIFIRHIHTILYYTIHTILYHTHYTILYHTHYTITYTPHYTIHRKAAQKIPLLKNHAYRKHWLSRRVRIIALCQKTKQNIWVRFGTPPRF